MAKSQQPVSEAQQQAAFAAYFAHVKELNAADATEHSLRPALYNLLRALADERTVITHEAKQDKTGLGAPDFKFSRQGSILGYLENKKLEENLDKTLRSAQIAKYQQLSGNLLLTNYLEWLWLRDGAVIRRETLCYASDVGNRKARLDPDKATKIAALLHDFLSVAPTGIARAKDLALALATRCHALRDFLGEELARQEREQQQGKLFGLFEVFRRDVFHELDSAGFADAFAQMLGYGLFLARLNSDGKAPITLQNARQFIPASFALIRELVNFLDELALPDYRNIKWLIEEILSLMNNLNLAEVQEDLAFSKRQGRLLTQTEEERLLFAKDPYVYFYEDFLKAYDKAMRKGRGVYYTPPPVVNFIVRAINDVLRGCFGIKDGLADRKRVTVLDFATGTGTFLLEVLHQIFDTVPAGLRDDIIRDHALKNLYGFEYLIAPYTIAHLKLSQFLHDKGYAMQPKERLQIYLTNTLEPIAPQPNFLLPELSKEVAAAQDIKDKKILVITGNPPYSGHSKNTGDWITGLIKTYKMVDGQPLGEKNPKWLQDDYVKFIRFAQYKMDLVDEGIVAIITNHSFLDNPTFRGMRQSLMQSFDQLYLLDLHGNAKKKESAPDGGKDENVFDIEQGVAVSLFVKKRGLPRGVFHADMFGKRGDKYRRCLESGLREGLDWQELNPSSPNYLFIPQDETQRTAYEQGWKVTEIFPVNVLGFQTHRDDFAIAFERADIEARVRDMLNKTISPETLAKQYGLKDSSGWQLAKTRRALQENADRSCSIIPCAYRPFDTRWCYFGEEFMDRPRRQIIDHIFKRDNLSLLCPRQASLPTWKHASVANFPAESCAISDKTSEGNYVFPLYLYNMPKPKKAKTTLFEEAEVDPFNGQERIENIAPAFRAFINEKYGKAYAPEEILGYIYAVLHSPRYRARYADFLKADFPRIPFVPEHKAFEKLAALGWSLVQAHLLREVPPSPKVTITKGSDLVEKPSYDAATQKLFFNPAQYFVPVPPEVWDFHIGGYPVLEKYLKSRKGRTLSLDEKETIIATIQALAFTLQQMAAIDKVLALPEA